MNSRKSIWKVPVFPFHEKCLAEICMLDEKNSLRDFFEGLCLDFKSFVFFSKKFFFRNIWILMLLFMSRKVEICFLKHPIAKRFVFITKAIHLLPRIFFFFNFFAQRILATQWLIYERF